MAAGDGRCRDNPRLCCTRCSDRLAPVGHDSLARQEIRTRATRKRSGEGILGRLPRSDRAGGDLVDCSQQRAGAGGPCIRHAPLYAGRRLGGLIYFEDEPGPELLRGNSGDAGHRHYCRQGVSD